MRHPGHRGHRSVHAQVMPLAEASVWREVGKTERCRQHFRITFEQYGTAGLVPCHNDGRTAPEVVESAPAHDQALRRNAAPIIAALAQAHGVDLSEFGRQQPEVDRSPKFVSRTCGRIHRIPPDPRATAGAAGRCPRAVSRSRTGEICGRHAKTIGPRLRTNSCTRCLR